MKRGRLQSVVSNAVGRMQEQIKKGGGEIISRYQRIQQLLQMKGRFLRACIVFTIFVSVLAIPCSGWSLSITSPIEGLEIHAGDSVIVVAEPGVAEQIDSIQFASLKQVFIDKAPPFEHTITVPLDALGPMGIGVLALDKTTGRLLNADVTVLVSLPPNVNLQRMDADPDQIILFGVDESTKIHIYGIYSDGVKRRLESSLVGTTYQTSDPRIAAVDTEGLVTAVSSGKAVITVKNGNKQLQIQINVKAKKN